jgi:hypothetical protein
LLEAIIRIRSEAVVVMAPAVDNEEIDHDADAEPG